MVSSDRRVTGYSSYVTLTLHHPDGQVFVFDAGALSLELTFGTGGQDFRARFEILHEPADLDEWTAMSRLGRPSVTTVEDLVEVKRLREAIYHATVAITDGGEPSRADVETINAYAAGPSPVPVIDGSGATAWRGPLTGAEVVAEIARDAVHTLGRPTRDRLRVCGGERCALTFLDTSRPGRRRWCSMQRCGNRHKVHTFRSRQAPE